MIGKFDRLGIKIARSSPGPTLNCTCRKDAGALQVDVSGCQCPVVEWSGRAKLRMTDDLDVSASLNSHNGWTSRPTAEFAGIALTGALAPRGLPARLL